MTAKKSNNTGRPIASGSFGSVFEHLTDIDKVVKVVEQDDCSLNWYYVCMEHNKSYMPRIYSIEMNENHQVEIVMERLDMTFTQAFVLMPSMKKFLYHVLMGIEYHTNASIETQRFLNICDLSSIMLEVRKFLKPLFQKFSSDIHSGNLMLRHRGEGSYEWVITDPIF